MKRYVCTVATGLLLALVSTGTATATLIPLPSPTDQTGTQETTFGDQTVGEQKNDADVTQAQGNGNLNIAPAVAIFGDAETTNAQGNGNTATADVDQSNSVDQTQSSQQTQSLDQNGTGCCDGQSQTGEQKVYGGDQTVGEQKNDADVNQYQGNGNVNVSPAIAVFGDAETTNYQGNGNEANATITQSNDATQSQSSTQRQSLDQSDTGCCGGQSQTGVQKVYGGDQTVGERQNDADVNQYQGNGNVNVSPAIALFGDAKTKNAQGNGNRANADVTQSNSVTQSQSATQKQYLSQDGGNCCKPTYGSPKNGYASKENHGCCDGQSQTGEQKTSFGDQTVGEQKNYADVTQKQGNGNLNISPALGLGGGKEHAPCNSRCQSSWRPHGGGAETTNYQGNGNTANADIDQSNSVTQSQSATQKQYLTQDGGNCCKPAYRPQTKKADWRTECCASPSQTGEQKVYGGDQTVGEQKNDADVTQKQGNWNLNASPAIGLGGAKERTSCNSTCKTSWRPSGGDATTANYQGNWNEANANIGQSNSADQSQTSYQRQNVVDMCKGLIYR
ncbi:MAG TPA: hypothetical protein VJM06_01220 [Gaiellaceae bacterium]|nr:hypothetical protein [Gaiellaceae bacterium]